MQNKLKHPCQICGIETLNLKFCSNKCTAKYNKIRLTGMVSMVKGIERLPRVIRLCKICSVEMRVKEKSARKYCSRKCQNAGSGEANKGRVAWNKGIRPSTFIERIQIKCSLLSCSNLISVRPQMAQKLIDEKRNHYCSRECYLISVSNRTKGSRNPMFGRKRYFSEATIEKFKIKTHGHGKAGFRDDIGHFVRSSWEADFARLWKYLKVPYEYEKHRFDLDEFGKYKPDFYLPELDRYYEVKGQMDMVFIEKRLKKLYEKYHIEINMVTHANFLWMLLYTKENLPNLFETLENKNLVKYYDWGRVHALQQKEYNKIEDELTKAGTHFIEPHILKQLEAEEPKISLVAYER